MADSIPRQAVEKLSPDTTFEPALAFHRLGSSCVHLCVNDSPAGIDFGGSAEPGVVIVNTLVEVFAVAGIPSPRLRQNDIDGKQKSLSPEEWTAIWWRGAAFRRSGSSRPPIVNRGVCRMRLPGTHGVRLVSYRRPLSPLLYINLCSGAATRGTGLLEQ